MSIYVTQLNFAKAEHEDELLHFEELVAPIIKRHSGEVILRLRPGDETVIEASLGKPYEVHIVRFDRESHLQDYLADPERRKYVHLKESAVISSLTLLGKKL